MMDCCLLMVDKFDVSIGDAIMDKFKKNVAKYPVDKSSKIFTEIWSIAFELIIKLFIFLITTEFWEMSKTIFEVLLYGYNYLDDNNSKTKLSLFGYR